MMGGDDTRQVEKIASLEANFQHIMKAVDLINLRLERLPTHEDLKVYATAAEVSALKQQITDLQRQLEDAKLMIEERSPATLWQRLVKVALGIGAIGGAFAILSRYVSLTWRQ